MFKTWHRNSLYVVCILCHAFFVNITMNMVRDEPNYEGLYWILGEGNGNPLQYSCLENPMDGGAWKAAVHGVTEGQTRLSDFTFTFHFHALEKEMATHSSVLAWRIPEKGEPGGLPSMGSHRIGHEWSGLAVAAAYTYISIYFLKSSFLSTSLGIGDTNRQASEFFSETRCGVVLLLWVELCPSKDKLKFYSPLPQKVNSSLLEISSS